MKYVRRMLVCFVAAMLLFVGGSMAKISAIAEMQSFEVVALQNTCEKGTVEGYPSFIFFGFEKPEGEKPAKTSQGVIYQNMAEVATYYMSNAKVTLIRDRESYVYTQQSEKDSNCKLSFHQKLRDNKYNVKISLSVFKQANYSNLDASYSRRAGDIVIVEGTWLSMEAVYSVTFEKFMVTIGEDTTDMIVSEYQAPVSDPYAMEMVSGASIRLNSEKKGLRFAAALGTSFDEESTYHVMIVPKSYLDYFGITDDYYEKLRAALEKEGLSTYIATMEATPFYYTPAEIQKSNGQLKEGVLYIRGSLTSVKAENMTTEFFGIAYRIDKAGNYHYASFQEGENVRSLAGVAQKALEDTVTQYSDEEKTILEEYASYAN